VFGQLVKDLGFTERLAHKVVTTLRQDYLAILFKGAGGQGDNDCSICTWVCD